MFVLLDIEWIAIEDGEKELTQFAAARVDSDWTITDRFEAVLYPACMPACDPEHMAFHGYPIEAFARGEKKEAALQRFSLWLREEDVLCLWKSGHKKVFSDVWQSVFQTPIPHSFTYLKRKICPMMQNRERKVSNLYKVAAAAGISPVEELKHCSKCDVDLMRELAFIVGLPQENLHTNSQPKKKEKSLAEKNRAMLAKTQYNYLYLPTSTVFHTKTCPFLLRGKTIQGCVYYRTATKYRRPCKICKPAEEAKLVNLSEGKTKEKPPKSQKSETDWKESVKVKLVSGEVVETSKGKLLGYCHGVLHPGFITRSILYSHRCMEKKCSSFEKYRDAPFWVEREKQKREREKAKQQKKEAKQLRIVEAEKLETLRKEFQQYADETDSALQIVRVEKPNSKTYKLYYVSDNRFADGNRFPAFLEKTRAIFAKHRIIIRHIVDVDGHFVTREEYRTRRK